MVLALNETTKKVINMTDYRPGKKSPTLHPATYEFLEEKFETPDIFLVQKAIAECHATHHSGCVQGMHLFGESGTGKSYTITDYGDDYPRYYENGQEIVPVLYVSLLEKVTTKALMKRILRTLTGQTKVPGDEEDIQAMLVKRLFAAKTEVVFIDETQHLTRESSPVSAQHAADAIKALMDSTGIAIICIGVDRSLALLMGKSKFKKEKQLKRRNRRMYSLIAYECGSENWKDLMEYYQELLNCEEDLTSDEMLKRMHVATYGLFGNLTPLFKEAIEITGDFESINKGVLAQAYIEFQPKNELSFNPFEATLSTLEMELTERIIDEEDDTEEVA